MGRTPTVLDNPVPRVWPLLFLATYLIHIAEEFWGGEGFYNWISRWGGAGFTAERFLAVNAFAWTAMLAFCLFATAVPRIHWISISAGTVVLLNGIVHTIGSLVTRTYSPGVV